MRIRTIKPEFWRDPDTTGRWPADLKLFYVGLWCVADDSGRFAWDEELIAADLFPFDRAADVGALLERLEKTGRVVRYEAAGRRYGFLPKFNKHQRINRPTESRLPEPPASTGEASVSPHVALTDASPPEGKGREQGKDLAAAREPDAPPRRKPYPIVDSTDLGPLGAEWRGLLERELGRGLAVAAAGEVDAVRAELEQLLERPHHGGVERALAWTVTTLAARRRSKAPEPGSVRYLLPLLREMPPIEVGAFDRVRAECPQWAAVLDAAMSLPPGNAPTEHQLEDVLLRLRATFLRGELHLEAADENRRGLVAGFWLDGLTRLAQETLGAHVLVHLTAAAEPEARSA